MDLKQFVLGGKAILTLLNTETGNRRTYSIWRSKNGSFYVSTRGDAEAIKKDHKGWSKVGWIPDTDKPRFVHTRYSEVNKTSMAFRGFEWLWRKIVKGDGLPPMMVVYHEGHCGRCGRSLTDPESIDRGFGPECFKKMI
jgi:hypothetical protein